MVSIDFSDDDAGAPDPSFAAAFVTRRTRTAALAGLLLIPRPAIRTLSP